MPLNNLGAGLNKAAKTGGGASTFTGLTDTPGSLGSTGQVVRVDGAGTALEFATLSGTGDLLADGTIPLTANWDIGGFELQNVDAVVLEASPEVTPSEGALYWNPTDQCLAVKNAESDIELNVGQEAWVRVYNDSGGTISNGEVVYITGKEDTENRPTIAKAQADSTDTGAVIGLATHDIENASFGYITQFGVVNDIDTSSFSDGARVWLSPDTAGALTATEPQSPNISVFVGWVLDSHATTGNLFVTAIGNTGGDVAGQSTALTIPARKGTAGTISLGQAVYITGYNVGQAAVEVELADSDSPSTMPALGLAAGEITNSATGNVVFSGRLGGLDTSSYTVNDPLYVSGTAGALTATKPVGSALIQAVARVERVNASNGIVQVMGAGRSNDIPNFSAADKFWYGGTSGVSTEGDITSAGRALLDDADASAQRTTLGLGSAALLASTAVVLVDGSQALTANWDVGAFTITGTRFISDIATGTAPFGASSTTLVANLNADLLDGQEGSYYRDADNINAGTLGIARTTAVSRRHQINYLVTGDDIATGEPFVAYVRVPWKCTIKNIGHQVDAATSVTWNLEERATRGSAGTDVFSSDEVSTTTYQEETTFSNAGLAADDWLVLSISAISGTPTQLLIEVEVEVDTDAS